MPGLFQRVPVNHEGAEESGITNASCKKLEAPRVGAFGKELAGFWFGEVNDGGHAHPLKATAMK